MLSESQTLSSHNDPFDHWVIDNFFDPNVAKQLEQDFYDFDDERWLTKNHTEFEQKRLSTHWDWYPKSIYSAFFYLCSQEFIQYLESITGISGLIADYGLHAGGMHIHGANGGRLNLHQDAELHPKLGLKRKLNIIIYLNSNWQESWGGSLELWSASSHDGQPDKRVKEISPMFNRAFIFDTTQNSWHGLPNEDAIRSPENEHRKSIALFYYLENDILDTDKRTRAIFAPTDWQKNDQEIMSKIHDRLKKEATWNGR